jgi:hypothetical protein
MMETCILPPQQQQKRLQHAKNCHYPFRSLKLPTRKKGLKMSEIHLPFGLPPIFPDLSEQLESYLTQPERFPIHNSEDAIRYMSWFILYHRPILYVGLFPKHHKTYTPQKIRLISINVILFRFWDRTPEPKRLLHAQFSPLSTTLKVERDFTTGRVLGFKEVRLKDAGTTAKNSTSLLRKPGPPDEFTRGCSNNYPFWPGGFDVDQPAVAPETHDLAIPDEPSSYLTCPPGKTFSLDLR